MSRLIIVLLPLLLALAHCAPPPPPLPPAPVAAGGQGRGDAATITACRAHADEVYDRQRRDTIYTITNRDAPFSGNDSTTGIVDRGLSQRFGRENMIRECVRNSEPDRAIPSVTAAPAPSATAAPARPRP